MAHEPNGDDIVAIRALIARQFASLSWSPSHPADWSAFERDFLPSALLYPSARPAAPQTVAAFLARMQQLAAGDLASLDERVLGVGIRVFGQVAMAAVACEMIENGQPGPNTVEMLLLVKSEGARRIAAQAWDRESPSNPIPPDLN